MTNGEILALPKQIAIELEKLNDDLRSFDTQITICGPWCSISVAVVTRSYSYIL